MTQGFVQESLIDSLRESTKELRKTLLTMIHTAQSGHPGGSLSASEIVATLYFNELRIKPEEPRWPDRDRFVLSKGHVCPVLYSALALRGYFPYETIYTLRKEGSMLQGHPDMKRCPGIDISTGSLGQGLSTAVGMAIAGKRDRRDYRVFCLVGDGETQEGQIWEALQTASKYKLDNLVVIIDNNNIQNDDACAVVMPLGDLEAKLKAFGLWTHVIDGHDLVQITSVFDQIRDNKSGSPVAIVAKTVKGKGVSFMEGVTSWHGQAPNDDEFARAIAEIEGEGK